MYESILLPVDGSPFGEVARPAAVSLAKRTSARLHIVHVRGGMVAVLPATGGLQPVWGPQGEAAARVYLDSVAERAALDLGESVSFSLLDPPVVMALCDYSRAHDISLIVMSTHGRSGLSRAWLGSVAAGVIREAAVPVLLVRPRKGGARPGTALRMRRILVPLDGSPAAEAILPHASALGKLTGGTLLLVHVVEPWFRIGDAVLVPATNVDEEETAQRRASAQVYLERIAASLRTDGVTVGVAVVEGEAVHAIQDTATAQKADLIALATHGRTGWQRLAMGSIADKVVRASNLPVLVFRPPAEESV
jgi:nucleotide-binding universal stress UspA family protein